MRLVYLYTNQKGFRPEQYFSDGYHLLFEQLLKIQAVDEVLVCWEDPYLADRKVHKQTKNYTVIAIPHIDTIGCELRFGDIIWIRGGWKHWIPWIEDWNKKKHWLLYYGANTGHERWPFWDVVWVDTEKNRDNLGMDSIGRFWLPFSKPISDMFSYAKTNLKYDLCLGSSHISHRKGQYRSFKVLQAYEDIFEERLKCLMLGSFTGRDKKTMRMRKAIHIRKQLSGHSSILMPGDLPRKKVAKYLKQTKVFIHMGGGGQNDRSVIEAGLAGCYIVVHNKENHPPWLGENPDCVWIPPDPTDHARIAVHIHNALKRISRIHKSHIAAYFQRKNGMALKVLPTVANLMTFFRENPTVNKEAIERYYGAIREYIW